jgi:tetratricopeptide (TPR) repeat protein
MACIDQKDIPQSLLPAGTLRKKEIEAIGTLRAYSFIIQRGEAMVFDLHRLVHLATRNWLQKEGALSRWAGAVIERLGGLFPDDEHQNRAQWRVLLPHAAYVLRQDVVEQCNIRRLDLTLKYSKSLYIGGRYKEAEKPFEQLFEMRKRVLGEEHPDTLASMAWLASLYRDQGRRKEAEELFVRVIETSNRVLGEEHPETLTSMSYLAFTRKGLGRNEEAIELMDKCVQLMLGSSHPHTLSSLETLDSWRLENLKID